MNAEETQALADLRAYLNDIPKDARVVCLHDCDADGVAGGVVWQRAMERLGYTDIARVIPDRERNAWTLENRKRVAEAFDIGNATTRRLFVLDLGSQSNPVAPGIPTCFIDHHRPEGVPPGDTLISSYLWDPIPNTSLMVYDLFGSLTDITDLDWIAAIGTISDLGDQAPFPLVEQCKKKYTAKYLKEVTALVNAARRSARYEPEIAAEALLAFDSPKSLYLSADIAVERLKEDRAEVAAALAEAKKAAPVFAGQVALVQIHSACQIHPLIAQIWRSRLPKYIVICANDRFLPGRVNFSARGSDGTNVLQFLRDIDLDLEEGEGNYGHGHDAASGGSLPVEQWEKLLEAIGFETRPVKQSNP